MVAPPASGVLLDPLCILGPARVRSHYDKLGFPAVTRVRVGPEASSCSGTPNGVFDASRRTTRRVCAAPVVRVHGPAPRHAAMLPSRTSAMGQSSIAVSSRARPRGRCMIYSRLVATIIVVARFVVDLMRRYIQCASAGLVRSSRRSGDGICTRFIVNHR